VALAAHIQRTVLLVDQVAGAAERVSGAVELLIKDMLVAMGRMRQPTALAAAAVLAWLGLMGQRLRELTVETVFPLQSLELQQLVLVVVVVALTRQATLRVLEVQAAEEMLVKHTLVMEIQLLQILEAVAVALQTTQVTTFNMEEQAAQASL
tara:strand:- start:38 stop:493 length:456 start_codon:yes stop_codon:yes gene_type:complete